jgi:hypothetical protein
VLTLALAPLLELTPRCVLDPCAQVQVGEQLLR